MSPGTKLCIHYCSKPIIQTVRFVTPRQKLKGYIFPEIRREDCEQKFISGWGPGGQKVNTAQNAVMLKHIPTGIVVKVHESRLLSKNIEVAYERLKYALDRYINKEDCYEEQLKKLERAREGKMKRRREALRQMKQELME